MRNEALRKLKEINTTTISVLKSTSFKHNLCTPYLFRSNFKLQLKMAYTSSYISRRMHEGHLCTKIQESISITNVKHNQEIFVINSSPSYLFGYQL